MYESNVSCPDPTLSRAGCTGGVWEREYLLESRAPPVRASRLGAKLSLNLVWALGTRLNSSSSSSEMAHQRILSRGNHVPTVLRVGEQIQHFSYLARPLFSCSKNSIRSTGTSMAMRLVWSCSVFLLLAGNNLSHMARPYPAEGSGPMPKLQLIYLPFATSTAQCCNHSYIIGASLSEPHTSVVYGNTCFDQPTN